MIRPTCSGGPTLFAAKIPLTLVGILIGCSRPAAPPANVVRPVKTMIVTAGDDTRVRSFPGRVETSRNVELAFQVAGLLVKLPVKEGQEVKEGDVIGQLREDEFKARLNSLQGQLDQARANLQALRAGERPEEIRRREAQVRAARARLSKSRADLDRATRLVGSRTISRAEFDSTESAFRVAEEEYTAALELLEKGSVAREEDVQAGEAAVRGLEARVVEANLNLQDSTLRAPYDGVIAQRFVEEGQNVQVKQPIVRLQDVEEIDIAVDVPETVMVADIRTADIVELVAELSGAPGIQIPVHIREIAQVADPTTQTFNVRVAMQAPPGIRALPGMTATVTATYRRASILGKRIAVPIGSIAKSALGSQQAWVIDADDKVVSRPVKLGDVLGGDIEILDGLNPGDRIAVAGVSFLREGMQVTDLGDGLGDRLP